jgi:hypothetical protein
MRVTEDFNQGVTKRCRVVYLGWPIEPSYMSPNAGGGGVAGSQPMSTAVSAYVCLEDLTPCLTYDLPFQMLFLEVKIFYFYLLRLMRTLLGQLLKGREYRLKLTLEIVLLNTIRIEKSLDLSSCFLWWDMKEEQKRAIIHLKNGQKNHEHYLNARRSSTNKTQGSQALQHWSNIHRFSIVSTLLLSNWALFLKRLGHEIDFKFFDKNVLNRNPCWLLNFKYDHRWALSAPILPLFIENLLEEFTL